MTSVGPSSRVTLHYRVSCGGSDIVNTFADTPDTFTLGQGDMDPRLEWLLQGLKAGDHQTHALGPEQAFGQRDESRVKHLPRADFPHDMALEPGMVVEFPMPGGQILTATLVHADEHQVTVDFNHPLAGKAVEFEIQIIAVEPP